MRIDERFRNGLGYPRRQEYHPVLRSAYLFGQQGAGRGLKCRHS